MSHLCPPWLGRLLASPVRRLLHDPETLLRPFVQAGDTVLEVGPGMGFFTLGLASLVGERGRVVAVDLQPEMLQEVARRAARVGLADRLTTQVCGPDALGLEGVTADFALLFWVVHEVPDQPALLAEVLAALRPGGVCLVTEPRLHVAAPDFAATVAAAVAAGFCDEARPVIRASHAAVLRRPAV